MVVEGKRIKIVTGRKTQTVNVYGDNNTEGFYSHKVRISSPTEFVAEDLLAQRNLQTIADLVQYLETTHHGVLEVAASRITPAVFSRKHKAEVSPSWCDSIAGYVEQALNAVVTDFQINPYRHRVEHSIHCQLYMELLKCPGLDGHHTIANHNIGFIHKEYPETTSRPEKDGRRGNFDMAIIGPVDEAAVNLEIKDFMVGLIKPGIALEVGLDYGASHLHSDWEKLKNSNIKRGYLLHLGRETGNPQDDKGLAFSNVYQKILVDEMNGSPQLAMCVFEGNKKYLKLIGQPLSVTEQSGSDNKIVTI